MLSRGIHFVFKESTVVAKESTVVAKSQLMLLRKICLRIQLLTMRPHVKYKIIIK